MAALRRMVVGLFSLPLRATAMKGTAMKGRESLAVVRFARMERRRPPETPDPVRVANEKAGRSVTAARPDSAAGWTPDCPRRKLRLAAERRSWANRVKLRPAAEPCRDAPRRVAAHIHPGGKLPNLPPQKSHRNPVAPILCKKSPAAVELAQAVQFEASLRVG